MRRFESRSVVVGVLATIISLTAATPCVFALRTNTQSMTNHLDICGEFNLVDIETEFLAAKDEGGLTVLDRLTGDLRARGPDPRGLTIAEEAAIRQYTLTNNKGSNDSTDGRKLQCILTTAASKLPAKRIILYRGTLIRGTVNAIREPYETTDHIVGASADLDIALGFLKLDVASKELSRNEIRVYHVAKARDISSYSEAHIEGTDEKEHLLLPGTRLRLDRTCSKSIRMINPITNNRKTYLIRFVEYHEVVPNSSGDEIAVSLKSVCQ